MGLNLQLLVPLAGNQAIRVKREKTSNWYQARETRNRCNARENIQLGHPTANWCQGRENARNPSLDC